MSRVVDDDYVNDLLAPTRRNIEQIESHVEALRYQVMLARAQIALRQQPAFKKLLEDLEGLRQKQLTALVDRRLDQYQLGLRQGFLRALKGVSPAEPASDAQIAEWERKIEDGLRLLEEENRTLQIGTGVAPGV